jgi:hypothetical protein
MKNPLAALWKLYKQPSPLTLAIQELVEAEHALLVAHTGKEWAEMSVIYNEKRIARLREYIKGETT